MLIPAVKTSILPLSTAGQVNRTLDKQNLYLVPKSSVLQSETVLSFSSKAHETSNSHQSIVPVVGAGGCFIMHCPRVPIKIAVKKIQLLHEGPNQHKALVSFIGTTKIGLVMVTLAHEYRPPVELRKGCSCF